MVGSRPDLNQTAASTSPGRPTALTGTLDPNDAAADLDDVETTYFAGPESHFWVAEDRGLVIASVGLVTDEHLVAHVRRLRVDPAWRTWEDGEVARRVIRAAAEHAREHGPLQLVVQTPVQDDEAAAYLHRFGFEFSRAKEYQGRHLLEFYLNLYDRPDPSARGTRAW